MKKFFGYLMAVSIIGTSIVGCASNKNSTKGGILGSGTTGTVTKTVMTVVGAIVLMKIINSVMKKVQGNTAFASLNQGQGFTQNFNENTSIAPLKNNELMQTALQALVSSQYKIPFNTVSNGFSSMNTLGDLGTFIGQNAPASVLEQFK